MTERIHLPLCFPFAQRRFVCFRYELVTMGMSRHKLELAA